MTPAPRGTDRPFTVIVCADCGSGHALSVVDELRPSIRRCPHGVLVSAACMLGPMTCAARPAGCGVMALLQPCTSARDACRPPQWIGPITSHAQAAALRDWLESGEWESTPLPARLGGFAAWAKNSSSRN
ncbi:hypothetical protein [Mycobacterium sp. THU-M104]|uniref:hypothetical protein n=1 Tax=Mycobacterium sp. THU-M104 TaxID=3410515 RepID=UPI003BA0CF72